MTEPLARAAEAAREVTHTDLLTALGAIREPSCKMIAAGAKKVRGGTAHDCAAAVWRAMHDAMMKE